MAVAVRYDSEVARLLDELGLTEHELAGALATTPRTVRRWMAGSASPQPAARERIEDLLRFTEDLRASVRADAIPKWTRRRIALLGDRRPADLLRAGDVEPLLELAAALRSGAHV